MFLTVAAIETDFERFVSDHIMAGLYERSKSLLPALSRNTLTHEAIATFTENMLV
jgi:hypothetical protein